MNRDRVCFGREAAEGAARSMMATEGESPPLKTVCNHAIHSQHEMRSSPAVRCRFSVLPEWRKVRLG